MPTVRVTVPIFLPYWLYLPLRKIKRALTLSRKPRINLLGDRDVEWSFVAAHIPDGPGEALDFGSGSSYMGLIAALKGFRVIALDLEPQTFPWRHPNVSFVQGDLLEIDWQPERFDVVINCSTVEHVGLVGRYSVTKERPNGDLEAMARLRILMKPGGVMLLTIPVGKDAVFAPCAECMAGSVCPVCWTVTSWKKKCSGSKTGRTGGCRRTRKRRLTLKPRQVRGTRCKMCMHWVVLS